MLLNTMIRGLHLSYISMIGWFKNELNCYPHPICGLKLKHEPIIWFHSVILYLSVIFTRRIFHSFQDVLFFSCLFSCNFQVVSKCGISRQKNPFIPFDKVVEWLTKQKRVEGWLTKQSVDAKWLMK